jgi:hypothetical protein
MLLAHFVSDAGQSDMVSDRFGGINRRTAFNRVDAFSIFKALGR